MQDNIRELWESTKRGTPMSRHFLWRALEALGFFSLLVLTCAAPFIASSISNPFYKAIVWIIFVFLILIFAFAIGLMPYWGMRETKKKLEIDRDFLSNKNIELAPLDKIRKKQMNDPINFIHPILLGIDGLDNAELDIIYISLTFINQLVDGLKIKRISGKLIIRELEQGFDFTNNAPFNFNDLLTSQKSNPIRQQIILLEPIKKRLEEIRISDDKYIKIVIIIEKENENNPMVFDPSSNDYPNLYWRLK